MDDRARALQDIAALARRHGFSSAEIASAIGEATETRERWRSVFVRVLGFLGGTFVFAGIGVFISLQWDHMNSAARVVVTLGSGLAAFVLAALSDSDARFDKATTPLFLVAAALEPTGMLVAFDEFGSGGDWHWASLATAGTMTLQYAALFRNTHRSTLLFLAILFGTLFWCTALDLVEAPGRVIAIIVGASLILTAVAIDRTRHRDITPLWYFLGAASFLSGFFDATKRTPFEISFLGVAAGFVYLSVVLHSRTLLFVATLAILAYTGWFTGHYFADSVGWPVALVAFGLFMIGLSALAFRIDRNYVRRRV